MIGNVPGNQGTITSGQPKDERLMARLPERDVKAAEESRGIFGWHPSNAVIATIFLAIIIIGPYLAFTGHIPFTSYGYEVKATFANGVNISTRSPVRIAGVEVGEVISVERDGDATTVSFTVDGSGRPIHKDAFAEIRPRIFLEGNFFIELDPGSPSSPELGSGETIPVSHTSTAVQLDEILTALQSPVRADLGSLLEGFGKALERKADRGRRRDPAARGPGPDRRRGAQRRLQIRRRRRPLQRPGRPTRCSAPARTTSRARSPAPAAPSAPSPGTRPTCRA